MFKKIFYILPLFFLLTYTSLHAACVGKMDIGPIFTRVKVIENNRTADYLDMWGFRVDASRRMGSSGFILKPTYMYAEGDGTLNAFGVGVAHCFPINEQWTLSPSIGVTRSILETRIDIPVLFLEDVRERFRSRSFYTGLEVSYNFTKTLRLQGTVQYAWARTWTKLEGVLNSKGNSKGPNYALQLEKDLNETFSLNLAGAYNTSLSKEKNGTKGYGCRIALSYWW